MSVQSYGPSNVGPEIEKFTFCMYPSGPRGSPGVPQYSKLVWSCIGMLGIKMISNMRRIQILMRSAIFRDFLKVAILSARNIARVENRAIFVTCATC